MCAGDVSGSVHRVEVLGTVSRVVLCVLMCKLCCVNITVRPEAQRSWRDSKGTVKEGKRCAV